MSQGSSFWESTVCSNHTEDGRCSCWNMFVKLKLECCACLWMFNITLSSITFWALKKLARSRQCWIYCLWCSLNFIFRKTLKRSYVPRYLHSAVFLGDVMLVFGGNSHNGTVQSQSGLPCFSMDFLAYDIGELSQVVLRVTVCSGHQDIYIVQSHKLKWEGGAVWLVCQY